MKKYSVKLVREKTFKYEANVGCSDEAYSLLRRLGYHMKPQEVFGVLMFSCNGDLIGFSEVSTGALSATIASPRDILQRALIANAASILVWHNHPSGSLTESGEDVSLTKKLEQACQCLDIKLLDHLVISENGYKSIISRIWEGGCNGK